MQTADGADKKNVLHKEITNAVLNPKSLKGSQEAKLIETVPNIVMGNYFSNKAMMPWYLSLYCCEFFHIEKSTFDLLFKNAGYEIFKTVLSKIDDVTNATQCHMLLVGRVLYEKTYTLIIKKYCHKH